MLQEAERAEGAAPGAAAPRPAAGRANFATVLRYAGFRHLWLGQVVSQVGDYFAILALMVVVSGWQSGTAATTAAVSGLLIALTLPRFVFGLLAGVFVDRWDRRRTMITSDLLRAALALGLIPALLSHQLAALYALAFALSAVGTLFNPAKGALIPLLVPAAQLTSANALSQTSQMLAQFVGPALAGATFAALGAANQPVAFAIDAGSFLVSAGSIGLIRVPAAAAPAARAPAGGPRAAVRAVGRELRTGLRAVVLNRTMALVALVYIVLNLGFGAINVLWVVFLRTQFGFTAGDLAWHLSLLDSGFAAGMLVASLVIGNLAAHVAPKWLITGGLLVAGVLLAGAGYLPGYWTVVAVMVGIGLCLAPIMAGTQTLTQLVARNDQLGRVGGALGAVSETATLLSMSLAGGLAGVVGIPPIFLLAGLLCLGAGALVWARLPARTPAGAGPGGAPAGADGLPRPT